MSEFLKMNRDDRSPWLSHPANSALSWISVAFTAVAAVASLAAGNGFMKSVLGFGPIEAFHWATAQGMAPTAAGFLFYQFLHGGAIHLYMNVAALKDLGTYVERSVGTSNYLKLFAFSWAVTYAVSVATYPEGTALAGISGFAFAVGGFLLPFSFSCNLGKRFWGSLAIVFAINFAISLSLPFVSLTAHATGFLTGTAFYAYFRYRYGTDFFKTVSACVAEARSTRAESEVADAGAVFSRTLVGATDGEKFAAGFSGFYPKVSAEVSRGG